MLVLDEGTSEETLIVLGGFNAIDYAGHMGPTADIYHTGNNSFR